METISNHQKTRRRRRHFSPERKAEVVQRIDQCNSISEGCREHDVSPSVYRKWKKQLANGIQYAMRSGRPPIDKEKKQLVV